MRTFLEEVGAKGYTDTFEDLHGLRQLPGMASQRLMALGYGFGGEGDWKTSALVRAMKVMGAGLPGGTSFMEDYTYHLSPKGHQVLGSHMLEICPTIAAGKPNVEIHPLGIGGKEDPVAPRLQRPRRRRPQRVARRSRQPLPPHRQRSRPPSKRRSSPNSPSRAPSGNANPTSRPRAPAWIYAGGAHHTGYSYSVTTEMLEDFATIAGIETVLINADTTLPALKQDLRNNEVYYHLAQGIRV